jgi:hypothetical protein
MRKFLYILITLFLTSILTLPQTQTYAQAYSTQFTTAITYQNVGTSQATISINFYSSPSSTTPIVYNPPNLAAGQGASLFIGGISSIPSGFQGSAVISSDQPIVATLVQVPQGSSTVFVRPMSNGFSEGAPRALIATVLKNQFGSHSKFSIQNMDSVANNVNIKFYNLSAAVVHEINTTIQPGAAFYVDAATVSQLGTSFNGSVVATAKRSDNTDGKIVGSSVELDITGTGGKAFESVASGATTIYMPSALCKFTAAQQNTAYAVQNTSLSNSTNVTVTYNPGGLSETKSIGPGAKATFFTCDVVGAGFIGSAIVTSSSTDVIAVGKAYGGGLSTAHLGSPSGSSKIALPYVRWAPDTYYFNGSRQRTYIAVQNVGGSNIPAGSITLTYTDPFGHTGTHTYNQPLAIGEKFNSNPTNAGLTWFGMGEPPSSSYGGGVIINCTAPNCQLVAIARVQTYVPATSSTAAEAKNRL